MKRGGYINTFAIILAVVVIAGLGYYISVQKETAVPAGSAAAPYASEEECEAQTGNECNFGNCDYIPEGKTDKEVCGKNFRGKGYYPNDFNFFE